MLRTKPLCYELNLQVTQVLGGLIEDGMPDGYLSASHVQQCVNDVGAVAVAAIEGALWH